MAYYVVAHLAIASALEQELAEWIVANRKMVDRPLHVKLLIDSLLVFHQCHFHCYPFWYFALLSKLNAVADTGFTLWIEENITPKINDCKFEIQINIWFNRPPYTCIVIIYALFWLDWHSSCCSKQFNPLYVH